MTSILLSDDGRTFKMSAKGHATGSTEVCSAISTIFISMGYFLSDYEENFKYKEEDGYCEIVCNGSLEAYGAFRMCCSGLKRLAEEYPEYVSLSLGDTSSKPL